MDYEELRAIVNKGEFDKLVGEIENNFFDCKSSPYTFGNVKGKSELAKDITSFANAKGGFIFLGIETEKNPTHLGDEVKRIHPFNQSLLHSQQYRDLFNEWIYPNPQDLSVEWVKNKSSPGRGIGVIKIPDQPDTHRPFLVAKTVLENKKIDVLFGYVQRKLDRSQHFTVHDLQRLLHEGLFYEESVNQRLKNIEIAVTKGGRVDTDIENLEEDISRRFYNALEYNDFITKRTIILTAYLTERNELKSVFNSMSDRESVRYKLANPPIIRPAGWDLVTVDTPKIIEGKFIRITNGHSKLMDLYRDGNFIFVGLADENFLAWGPNYSHQLKFNPAALVEIVYSFVRFYCEIILSDLESRPFTFSIGIDLRNMQINKAKNKLGPGDLASFSQIFDDYTKEAPNNDFSRTLEFYANLDVRRVAFVLLKEIYLWFGIEEDQVPYTKLENENRVVDPEQIKNLRKK